MTMGLCLGLAGVVWAGLPVSEFTLAWNHSIEKIRWEEDYRISAEGLLLEQARIKGSGAGMEIPDAAVLHDGSWHYRPELPPLNPLRLGRTPEAGDYQLCYQRRCHELSDWLGPPDADQPLVELWSCTPAAALTPASTRLFSLSIIPYPKSASQYPATTA